MTVRDDIEATLRSKLHRAPRLDAVIRFDLGGDGAIVLDGKATPPSVAETGPMPDTTIMVSAADLQAMLARTLSPMQVYSAGRLNVAGAMGPAMQLGSLLG